jgi:hypothetical protein
LASFQDDSGVLGPMIPWRERPARRWPTFSLRTMLEFVFVCAVVLYIWRVRPPENMIRAGHILEIDGAGTFIDSPIRGLYLVDPDGYVNLGATYGKVNVEGLTGDLAEMAVLSRLRQILANPQVTVSIAGGKDSWELQRIQTLEREVEHLKLERLSDQRRLKGLLDPQESRSAAR